MAWIGRGKKKWVRRDWLNKRGHHYTATVYTEIEQDGDWACADLFISDCSRQITLSFDKGSKSAKSNSLHKIRTLRSHLDDVERFLEGEL